MLSRFGNWELALLALTCVLMLLMFPAARGSYSATHGPISSLLEKRYAVTTFLAMAFAALSGAANNPVLAWRTSRVEAAGTAESACFKCMPPPTLRC